MFMTVSACAAAPAGGAAAQALEPIVYTIRVPSPATHVAQWMLSCRRTGARRSR